MLSKELAANKTYRFGKILALDIYATTAAIALWTIISRFSALSRGRKTRELKEEREAFAAGRQSAIAEETRDTGSPGVATQEDKKPSYASRMNAPAESYRALAEKEPAKPATIAH